MRFKNIAFLPTRLTICAALAVVFLSSCVEVPQKSTSASTSDVENTDTGIPEINSLKCNETSVERTLPDLQNANSLDDLEFIVACGDSIVPALLEGIESNDSNTRLVSVYLLGEISSDEYGVSSALIEAMQDDSADVRFAAIKALAKTSEIDSVDVIQPLLEALEDNDDGVRVGAAIGLLKRDSINPEIVSSLFETLGGGDHFKPRTPESSYDINPVKRTILIDGLDDGNWLMRKSAVDYLTKFAKEDPTVIGSFPQNTRFPSGIARGHIDEVLRQLGANLIIEAVDNEETRSDALRALIKVDRQKAIPILIDSLKDSDSYVRRLSVESLGEIGAKQAIPNLISVLEDSDISVSTAAANALGDMEAEAAIPSLIEILKNGEYQNANAAANALGRMYAQLDVQEVEPILLKMLQKEPEYLSAAVILAGQIKSSRAIPYLIALMSDDRRGASAAIALGKIGTEKSVDAIVLALKSSDSVVRKNAITAFSHFEESSEESSYMLRARQSEVLTLAQFLPKAADEWRDGFGGGIVRTSIARALGLVDTDIVVPILISSIPEEEGIPIFLEFLLNMTADKEVRETYRDFTRSISTYHDEEIRDFSLQYMESVSSDGISTLVDNISTSDGVTATTLSYIDSDEARAALTDYFNSRKEGYLSSRTIEAIGNIKSKAAAPLLIELIEERQYDQGDDSARYSIVRMAIAALGEIGSEEAVSTIARELKDDSWNVRLDAVQALGKIKSAEVIPSLIEALEDEQFYVSYAAAEALSELGPMAIPSLMEVIQQDPSTSPVLQTILNDKYAHPRRSALYVLSRIAELDKNTKITLASISRDEYEQEDVRLMSAVALESAGQDMNTFFDSNDLDNPLELSCLGPDRYIHIYAGMCLQEDQFPGGDGMYEIYLSLKGLFQRTNRQ